MEEYPKEVTLKNKKVVKLRLLEKDDLESLISFFQALPIENRMYLRSDVMQRENLMRRFGNIDYNKMYPLVAWFDSEIIAIGNLFRAEFGWQRNLGEIRIVVSPAFQRQGLCTILTRELFLYAVSTDLFKIQAELMENQKSAIAAFKRMGFHEEAVLKNHVTDIKGNVNGKTSSGSIAAEISYGKSPEELLDISDEDILTNLGGLPKEDEHCAFLAAATLHEAVNSYMIKQNKKLETRNWKKSDGF